MEKLFVEFVAICGICAAAIIVADVINNPGLLLLGMAGIAIVRLAVLLMHRLGLD